jgi:hypothetical protein
MEVLRRHHFVERYWMCSAQTNSIDASLTTVAIAAISGTESGDSVRPK